MNQNIFDYDVFISFSSKDEELTKPIWQGLCLNGLRVFWSNASLKDRLGESWFDIIQSSLDKSRHFLLICTKNSMSSPWVKREYTAFLNHCYTEGLRKLVPVLSNEFDKQDLPLFLRALEGGELGNNEIINKLVQIFGGTNLDALKKEIQSKDLEISNLKKKIEEMIRTIESKEIKEDIIEVHPKNSNSNEKKTEGIEIKKTQGNSVVLTTLAKEQISLRNVYLLYSGGFGPSKNDKGIKVEKGGINLFFEWEKINKIVFLNENIVGLKAFNVEIEFKDGKKDAFVMSQQWYGIDGVLCGETAYGPANIELKKIKVIDCTN
ncbi:MAG TPA: hypothetical protein DCQ31_09580 [Bacteroidales bacterium]|nr:hypothetical protein [Bacteroidales bacterium]